MYKFWFPLWHLQTLLTRLTRRVPLVEKEPLTLPEHLRSSPVLSGVRVTRSLVVCVCFVDHCLSFLSFFFWPLCCLFFFYLRILISPLASSNSFWYLPEITCLLCESVLNCLTTPHFIEVPVASQKSERSCICVLGVSIWPFSTFFSIIVWNYSDNVILHVFLFLFNTLTFPQ